MKVTDAAGRMTQAALLLSMLPREMATAIHASAANTDADGVSADDWATLRKVAKDPDDLPGLDDAMTQLDAAIAAIRAAFPAAPQSDA